MRVDLGNLTEITKKSAAVQNKGTQAVLNENITTKETDKTGHSYTVKSVTYETLLAEDKKSAEDIAMQAEAVDPQAMQDEMAVLANTTTEEDYEKMEEDGYSVNDTEIPEIVTEMDKIKIQLAKAGVDIRIFGDDVSVEKIAEVLGSAGVGQIEAALRMADLPATEQNVSETEEALEMAENLEPLSDGAKKYILDNGLDATIDNLYKAEYSAGGTGESYSVPSIEENTDFSQLDEQIQKMLQDTGFEITDENIEDSRWLLENEIPLTAENLESYQSLKDLRLPQDNEVVLKAITDAIAQGKRPKDAVLAITRQRQLEEVRLEMSAKANYALAGKDFSIDTDAIAETIEALKKAEEAYYEKFLSQGGVEPTEENIKIYQDIEQVFEELKGVPAYTLGVEEGSIETPQELHKAGKVLQDTFEKANESYETLMTAPRKDMGDSIQKAFRNVDDILTDLEMETNPANQRAVRILAYNQMEITKEAVLQMKAVDEKVQQTFENMKPQVVREMIKTGINPLDMNLDELNRTAVEIKEQLGIDNEDVRFSKYLYKLEQNSEIAEEERSAYIGIYRLIARVEQTDGAAIGMLAQQGAEFTMRNLLMAVRSSKKEGREYAVDDSFGGLEELETSGISVTDQIEAGYQNDCIKDIMREISPEKLAKIPDWENMTPEQFKQALEQLPEDVNLQKSYTEQEMAEYRNSAVASEEVYKMLEQYDLPKTVSTILAAQEMIGNRNGMFRKLFARAADTEDVTLADIEQQVLEEFAEAVKSPEDMAKAQKVLAETAENVMKSMKNESNVTSLDLKEMRMVQTQIELGTKMSKEETYQIPVLVGDSVTGVSLKIVRGKEEKGRVDILFEGDALGKTAAQISVKGDKIEGYIVSDSQATLSAMREQEEALSGMLKTEEEQEVEIRYVHAKDVDLAKFSAKTTETFDEEQSQTQTKTLYHMAESFLKTLRSLEISQ